MSEEMNTQELAALAFMQDMTKEMKKIRKIYFVHGRQFAIAMVTSSAIIAAAIASRK